MIEEFKKQRGGESNVMCAQCLSPFNRLKTLMEKNMVNVDDVAGTEQLTHTHTRAVNTNTGDRLGVTVDLNQIRTTLWRPLVPERLNIEAD